MEKNGCGVFLQRKISPCKMSPKKPRKLQFRFSFKEDVSLLTKVLNKCHFGAKWGAVEAAWDEVHQNVIDSLPDIRKI